MQKDLVSVYVSEVRPVLEYACPVWYPNLPQYLSDNIEVIQKRALKCIFPGLGYAEILRRVNMDTRYNVIHAKLIAIEVSNTCLPHRKGNVFLSRRMTLRVSVYR